LTVGSWEFAASLWDWKAPHPVFDHPLPLERGFKTPFSLGRRCPGGADEGSLNTKKPPGSNLQTANCRLMAANLTTPFSWGRRCPAGADEGKQKQE